MDTPQVTPAPAGVALPAVQQRVVVRDDDIAGAPLVGVAMARVIQRIAQRLLNSGNMRSR
jgi:hypothetical protein